MKEGRHIYETAELAGPKALPRFIARLKGREIAALIHYAEGLHAGNESRDEIIGTALIVAAERYLARVKAKAEKRMRKARKAL